MRREQISCKVRFSFALCCASKKTRRIVNELPNEYISGLLQQQKTYRKTIFGLQRKANYGFSEEDTLVFLRDKKCIKCSKLASDWVHEMVTLSTFPSSQKKQTNKPQTRILGSVDTSQANQALPGSLTLPNTKLVLVCPDSFSGVAVVTIRAF